MILWRGAFRQLLRRPWQTILAVIGVALGVGVVTAVDLANGSAERSFRLAAETMTGRATHQILGAGGGFPEEVYRALRVEHHLRQSAPVVEGDIRIRGRGGESLRLVGLDPFAEPPVRSFSSQFPSGTPLDRFLTQPGSCLVTPGTAGRLGLTIGGILDVEVDGRDGRLSLVGYLQPPDELSAQGLDGVIVADIATAQEVLGMFGRLSRIDLVLSDSSGNADFPNRVRSLLPAGLSLVPTGTEAGSFLQMTRALRLNLTALSLLALVVGMFLIYNTTTFAVLRRRRFIATLRTLGVTRREIFALVLAEALLMGLAGTAIGLSGGIILGRELTWLVTRTISDLYFVLEVRNFQLLPWTFVKAGALGVGATLLAALPAVREATGASPGVVLARSVLESRSRRTAPRLAAGGVIVMVAGAGMLAAEKGGIVGGFAGLFILISGYVLLIPGAVILLARLFRPLFKLALGVIGTMAARGVVSSLSRTGIATGALVVAVSASIGIGIMIGSFRLTVQEWLTNWLRADIYVTTTGTGTGRRKPPLDPALVARLAEVPGAKEVSLTRRVTVTTPEGPVEILALGVPESTFRRYPFKEGRPDAAWYAFQSGDAVLVSEPYAYRHKIHAGARLTLPTPRGIRSFAVAGVFYDYGSDQGVVAVSRAAYIRLWGDESVDGVGFYRQEGTDLPQLTERIRTVGKGARMTVVANSELRRNSLAVFDRTFAITRVLRILIIIVAFVGILSALMAIHLERARELAVARAVGLTPGQLWRLIFGETALMGIVAGILSVPLGLLQAVVLIYVVNRRSFGWTMPMAVEPLLIGQALLLSLLAALIAGIYPSVAMSRTSPALALKEEE